MKYFRETENPTARLPAGFMQGFLEVGIVVTVVESTMADHQLHRVAIEISVSEAYPTLIETCCQSSFENGRGHQMPHPMALTYLNIFKSF